MRYDKIILIPPHHAYGDIFSVIGLIYYLLEYYNQVFLSINGENEIFKFCEHFFYNEPLLNNRIYLSSDTDKLIKNSKYDEFHICSTHTGNWTIPSTIYLNESKVRREHYFNDVNPISNFLNISDKYKYYPNKHLPNTELSINHLFYYELIGLNNNVRMDYFSFNRNLEVELTYKKNILKKFNLSNNDKYNIVNVPNNYIDISYVSEKITNGYPIINLHYLSPCVGYLPLLIEDAEEIHLVESINTNFIYHCQYKNIINANKTVFFHIWANNRHWKMENMNLDFSYKMMETPKLDNWNFIFT